MPPAAPIRASSPYLSRRDSWPPDGGPPGSDVDFIREQLLDPYNITYGVLEPLLGGNKSRNLDEAAALCSRHERLAGGGVSPIPNRGCAHRS